MRDFECPNCGQRLAFENSLCFGCDGVVGFDLQTRGFAALDPDGLTRDGELLVCSNAACARCNWLAPARSASGLCASCRLTRTRPTDGDLEAARAFADAEAAKRRLVVGLVELGLPVRGREEEPVGGLCFDLLSSEQTDVVTGHADGVITLDLAEGDDVHRELMRVSLAEPYRTLLGHLRHEIGHYYQPLLVSTETNRAEFERLFGDPDSNYQTALDRHYAQGPPPNWRDSFVSAYASTHPAEDWAETFAHYLHIRDTLDTAAAFGFAPEAARVGSPFPATAGFRRLVTLWLPLAWSLNMLNRSMGQPDLYPFVLPAPALQKLCFVHRLVEEAARPARAGRTDASP